MEKIFILRSKKLGKIDSCFFVFLAVVEKVTTVVIYLMILKRHSSREKKSWPLKRDLLNIDRIINVKNCFLYLSLFLLMFLDCFCSYILLNFLVFRSVATLSLVFVFQQHVFRFLADSYVNVLFTLDRSFLPRKKVEGWKSVKKTQKKFPSNLC